MNQIDVANVALLSLEDGPISSLNEELEAARLCKAAMPWAIETTLKGHNWNCATRLGGLGAPLVQAPAHGYAYAYNLPADCLHVQRLGGVNDEISWKRVGKQVHCDVTPGPDLTYTVLIPVEEMDPACSDAVAFRLAALISRKLTGSTSHSDLANALSDQVSGWSTSLDASEGTPDIVDADGGDAGWADYM